MENNGHFQITSRSFFIERFFDYSFSHEPFPHYNIVSDKAACDTYFQSPYLKKFGVKFLCYHLWFMVDAEKKWLEENQENHFFQSCMNYVKRLSKEDQQIFYSFSTVMFFERKHITSHWNFKEQLDKNSQDKIIFSEIIHHGVKGLDFILKIFTWHDIEQARKISTSNFQKKDYQYEWNIRSRTIYHTLFSWGSELKKYVRVLNKLNSHITSPIDYHSITTHHQLRGMLYYPLKSINDTSLNQQRVKFICLDGSSIQTSFENHIKYNSMTKSLMQCINQQTAYGLDGNTYRDMDQLVNHFKQEPFLVEHMIAFMREKAKKAGKQNKAIWNFYIVTLNTPEKSENKKEKRQKI